MNETLSRTNMHTLTALDQAALIARGEVSSEQLTRAYLDRIAAFDGAIGAFVHLRPDAAIATARRLDRARARNPSALRGPLWGIPTAMKDLHFTRGFFARMGTRAYRYVWSPLDDVTSATLRAAGMVIVGKVSTSELAIMPIVESDVHGPTRNPWDLTRYAGGSSGGTAAALSAGMLPIASGSDGAGSIRLPAAFCGLVGLKTTRGLVPNPHSRFETVGISVIGPLARSADDAAALLDVLTGRVAHSTSFLASVRTNPKPLRMRFTTRSPVATVEPEVSRAVDRVVAALGALGHAIDEGPALDGTVEQFLPMFQFLAANTPVPFERLLQPTTRWLRETGRDVPFGQARAARTEFERMVGHWFQGVDAWVTPTVAFAAPLVGRWLGRPGRETIFDAAPLGAFTAAINASGHPAVSIPVWLDGHPRPMGVQIVGRHGRAGELLALARSVMTALGTPIAPLAPAPSARAAGVPTG